MQNITPDPGTENFLVKLARRHCAGCGRAWTSEDWVFPGYVCAECAAAVLAEGEHTPCTVDIADAAGDVHTIRMSHVSVRIGEQHRARLEAIATAATQRSTMPISTSLVLRRVIERGLAVVEHELGLVGPSTVSTCEEAGHG